MQKEDTANVDATPAETRPTQTIAWLTPETMPSIPWEYVDDVSMAFASTGSGIPFARPTGSGQKAHTGQSAAGVQEALTKQREPEKKENPWEQKQKEHDAAQEEHEKEERCKPWTEAMMIGRPDIPMCAGRKRCDNKRECYMCQVEAWEEYWDEFSDTLRAVGPEIVHARENDRG